MSFLISFFRNRGVVVMHGFGAFCSILRSKGWFFAQSFCKIFVFRCGVLVIGVVFGANDVVGNRGVVYVCVCVAWFCSLCYFFLMSKCGCLSTFIIPVCYIFPFFYYLSCKFE